MREIMLMRTLAAAAILAGLTSTAWTQEVTWVETSFHRVHLRNGNFIDGKLLSLSDREVSLALQQGNMNIRRDAIEKIEFVKMRSLLERPKMEQFPKGKAAPAAAEVKPAAAATVGALNITPPAIEEALKSKLTGILAGMKGATADQKVAFMKELTSQEGAAPFLASQLDSIGEEDLDYIGMALSQMKDPESLPYIVANLESGRESVVVQALKLVADLGGTAYTSKVRSLLSHSLTAVRSTAISTLERLSDGDSLTNILELLKDPERPVRNAAINAALNLGRKLNDTDAVMTGFSRALDVASTTAKIDLLSGIGRTKKTTSWEAVGPYLRDNDIGVREAAAEALMSLAATESADEIVSRLQIETEKSVRIRLAQAAAVIKSQKFVEPLINWLRSDDEILVKTANKALEDITGRRYNGFQEWSAWWDQVKTR
jgi:HEAT repeat protein